MVKKLNTKKKVQKKSLSNFIMSEKFDYPVLENTKNYSSRVSCISQLDKEFRAFLARTLKTIRREPHWFEVYKNGGRYTLFCDFNYANRNWELNAYWDDNNNIPPSWFMIRNSISAILGIE